MDLPTMGRSSVLRECRNGVRGADRALSGTRIGFTAVGRGALGPPSVARRVRLQRRNASSSFPCAPTCLSPAMARTGRGWIDRQPSAAACVADGEAWTAHFLDLNQT